MKYNQEIQERFFVKVQKSNNCWNWLAGTNRGYGRFGVNGVNIQAHRISLELSGVVIPKGRVIDHICRNRKCVNPKHLRVVTRKQNALENSDSVCVRHASKTHCPKGHLYSGTNLRLYKGSRKCVACVNARNKMRNKQ